MVFFVKALFEGIVHSIDGGFACVVSFHGVDVGFLNKEEHKKKRCKGCYDDDFKYSKAFFVHAFIISYLILI